MKETRTCGDDTDWELERMVKAIQWRCIRVEDSPETGFVDYHTIYKCQELEEIFGELLVDAVVEKSFFPNGRWEIPEGVCLNV